MAEDQEREFVSDHFRVGLRDFYARDLVASNDGDVRMGTFILCASFLDTLSLAYSAGTRVKGKTGEAKWRRFVTQYFGVEYTFMRDAYNSFRNRLLHNYSAGGILFTHGKDTASLHCGTDPTGQTYLHRESFVRDVLAALDAFENDVRTDPKLRSRVAKHWEQFPPMGIVTRDVTQI